MKTTVEKIDDLCYSIRECSAQIEDGGWEDCPELVEELEDYTKQLRQLVDKASSPDATEGS